MKNALCAAIALCATALPVLAAPDSAYEALRTVGTLRSPDVLNHVIELEGRGGVPQPIVWRVVLDDPAARGGVRELDVAHGKIISEHTPIRAYSGTSAGALIDFKKLNLDSTGAFAVIEKTAQAAKVGFDSVDYTRRTGDGPGATPVWVITMMDTNRHGVGSMSLAADTGVVVSSSLPGGPVPPPPTVATETVPPPPVYSDGDTDHDNLYAPAGEPTPVRQADDSDTEDSNGLRVGHRIKQAFLSAGQSLKNFVTGNTSSNNQ